MKNCIIIFVLFFFSACAKGQFMPATLWSARWNSDAYVTDSLFTTGGIVQPAVISRHWIISSGVEGNPFYTDHNFGYISMLVPTRGGSFSIIQAFSGGGGWRGMESSIGRAQRVSGKTSIGLRMVLHTDKFSGVAILPYLGTDVGMVHRIDNQLTVQWAVYNVFGKSFSEYDLWQRARMFRAGCSYSPTPGWMVWMDVSKEQGFTSQIQGGCRTQLTGRAHLDLALGFPGYPVTAGYGWGNTMYSFVGKVNHSIWLGWSATIQANKKIQ